MPVALNLRKEKVWSEINLLDDVAPASNELGAISDMAQQMYDLQEDYETGTVIETKEAGSR